jgi:hypothetical protein
MAPKAAPAEEAGEEAPAATPLPPITPVPIDPVLAFQEAMQLERQIESRLRKLSFVIQAGESSYQQIQKEHQCLRNPTKACVKRLDAGPAVRAGRQKIDNHLSYILSPRRDYPRSLPVTWPEKGARFHLTSQLKRELEKSSQEAPPRDQFVSQMDPAATLSGFGDLRSGHEDIERDQFEHQLDVKDDLEALKNLPVKEAVEATGSLLKDLKAQRTHLQELVLDKVTLGFPSHPGPRARPPPTRSKAGVLIQGPEEAVNYAMQLEHQAAEQWSKNWNIVKDSQKEGARALHGSLMPLDTWETHTSPRFLRYQF